MAFDSQARIGNTMTTSPSFTKSLSVAIDGPSGAGKGTIGKLLALRLGYQYIDTGAMYRAVALEAKNRGISWEDEALLSQLTQGLELRFGQKREGQLFSHGVDISDAIRVEAISQGASIVSKWPGVRSALVKVQRRMGELGGVVMDGRDIGTVVLPNADIKIFLTASIECRAQRRHAQLWENGQKIALEAVRQQIAERDHRDMNRETSPLRAADDAIPVDTSELSIDQVVAHILKLIDAKQGTLGL